MLNLRPFSVNVNSFVHPCLHRIDLSDTKLVVRMASVGELASIAFGVLTSIFIAALLGGIFLLLPDGIQAVRSTLPMILIVSVSLVIIALLCALLAVRAAGWVPRQELLVIARRGGCAEKNIRTITLESMRGIVVGNVVFVKDEALAAEHAGDGSHYQIVVSFVDGNNDIVHLLVAAHPSCRAMLRLAGMIADWSGLPLVRESGWRLASRSWGGCSAWGGALERGGVASGLEESI